VPEKRRAVAWLRGEEVAGMGAGNGSGMGVSAFSETPALGRCLYLTQSVFQVFLQKSTPPQIRQLILLYH
jgi:hypothetical protein